MRCTTAQKKLEAYLGGELTQKERGRVEGHLACCAECARALERARQMRRTLREKPTPPLPTGFYSRLMARARKRATKRSWTRRILRPFGLPANMPAGLRVAAAAAVIFAFCIGLLIGLDMWRAQAPWEAQSAQGAGAKLVSSYRIDFLAEAPEGSMTGAYVSLVSTGAGE